MSQFHNTTISADQNPVASDQNSDITDQNLNEPLSSPGQDLLTDLNALQGRANYLARTRALSARSTLEQKFGVGDFLLAVESLQQRAQQQERAQQQARGGRHGLNTSRAETLLGRQVKAECKKLLKELRTAHPGAILGDALRGYRNIAALWEPGNPLRDGRLSYSHLRFLSHQKDEALRRSLATRILDEEISAHQLQHIISTNTSARNSNGIPAVAHICAYSELPITNLATMVELRVPPSSVQPGADVKAFGGTLRGAAQIKGGQGIGTRTLRFADMRALQLWLADNLPSFLPASAPSEPSSES